MGRKRVGEEALRHLTAVIGERFTVCRSAPENDKGRKAPVGVGWQRKPVDLGEAYRGFRRDRNIGFLTGGQIAVLDFDADVDKYENRWPHLFTGLVCRRSNQLDRAKVFIRVIDGPLPKSRSVSGKGELLTIGATPADGRNAIVAGHFAGGTYELHGDRPVELTAAELGSIVDEWLGSQSRTDHNGKQTTTTGRQGGWAHEVTSAIETALLARPGSFRTATGITFRCVSGVHEDRTASAGWNPDLYGGSWNCLACQSKGGWKKLAVLLGVNLPPIPPNDRVRRRARAAADAVADRQWSGQSGATDQAVMAMICDAIEFYGCAGVRLGVRRISLGTGISSKTVATAIRERLVPGNHLIRKAMSAATDSDELRLGQEYHTKRSIVSLPEYQENNASCVVVLHADLFRRGGGGIGPACGLIYSRLLQNGPTSMSVLKSRTKYNSTLKRRLEKLVMHNVIVIEGDMVSAVEMSPEALGARSQGLADSRGRTVHGRGDSTARRYAEEQARFRQRMAPKEIAVTAWEMGADAPDVEVVDADTGEVRISGSMPEPPTVWPYLALLVDDDVDANIEIRPDDDVGWDDFHGAEGRALLRHLATIAMIHDRQSDRFRYAA